ncbi:MAG: hypothetical protein DWP95_10440 [Proteobacteria bacterium]|nr:MAG: hypothetical protein DWP95_10440 [Pseudomonadota bacterium]
MSVRALTLDFGVNLAGFTSDMDRAARIAKQRSEKIKRQIEGALKVVASGAVAAGAGLGALTKQYANTADSIQKMSQRLGISTEFLSQMRLGLGLTDNTLDGFSTSVSKMSKTINDGVNGLSTATRAFDALGITLDQLKSLDTEQQFLLIADRLSKVEDQSVKTGAAMDIFGRSGTKLITLFDEGAEGIKAYNKQADSFGKTISQDSADAAAKFNDQLTVLNARVTGLKESIGRDLLPVFSQMITNFNDGGISNAAGKFETINTTVIGVYKSALYLNGAFAAVGKTVGTLTGMVVESFKIMAGYVDVFVDRLKLGAVTIGEIFTKDIQEKANKIGAGWMVPESFKELTESAEELSQKITENEEKLLRSRENLANNIASDKTFSEIDGIYKNIESNIQKVEKAAKDAKKPIEDGITKPSEKAATAMAGLGKSAEETEKAMQKLVDDAFNEANELLNDFTGIVQSLETPMETLNRTTDEQVQIIGRYILANQGNEKAINDALEALKRLDAQYKDSEAEIKAAADATDEFRVALEQLGVPSHVLQQLQQVAALMGSITGSGGFSGIFTGDFASSLTGIFDELPKILQQAIEKADIEVSPSSDFTRMFEGLFAGGQESFRSAADMASLAQFAFDAWNRTEGQDDAGRVASTAADLAATGAFGPIAQAIGQIAQSLNAITGGRLFGTAYELTGSGFSGGVGLGGVSGSQYTESQRERSFFRGTQTRIDTSELDAQIREVLQKIQDAAEQIAEASAQALGVDVPNLVSGSIEQEFDADGNLVSSISTVLGRTFNEGIEEFGMRVSAENIIASLNQAFDPIIVQYDQVVQLFDDYGRAIGSFTQTANALVNEADYIANRWRMDAELFLDGAQMLLAAGTDIVNGVGLFDTLTEVADSIESMKKPSETLLDAYSRISEATSQLTDALDIMDISLDTSRMAFVQFAADISEAAGGVERSQALWQAYFDTFYSAEELAQNALDNAVTNRDSELADIGLDSGISNEAFRELFESILPTLSAEMVVEWLEAAEAIGVVIDAEAQLAQIRGQNADELAEMMAEIGSDLEDMDLSPFAKRLKDIKNAFNEQIATAKELGATERELAMIQTYASRQIQQAIAMLENDIRGALTDLYGTELDQINEQIALLEQQGSMIQQVGQANQNRYQDELRAIQNIQGYLDSLLLNDTLSTLNPMEQLQEAQAQFDEMLALAQMGDIHALNALPGLANVLLGLGRDVWASGEQYTDLFDMVTGALAGLGVTSSPGGDNTGTVMIGQNAELIALQQRANELMEQQAASQNFDAAWAIAEQIGQLSSVTNDSFAELAERLGLPVEQFLTDLGVDLENITVETSTALANVAATMGVEITELADAVGISLGNLADDQSLLNDALEATIMGLPQGIAEDLDAMLTAIEKSTNPEAREAMLAAMEEYISTLPADQANQLAPFFENIDPTTNASQQLSQMTQLNDTNQSIDAEIKAMRTESQQANQEADSDRNKQIQWLQSVDDKLGRFLDSQGVA